MRGVVPTTGTRPQSAAMVFRLTSLPKIFDSSPWETGWKYPTAISTIASNSDSARPLLASASKTSE